jgi:hypothetical protein
MSPPMDSGPVRCLLGRLDYALGDIGIDTEILVLNAGLKLRTEWFYGRHYYTSVR